MASYKPLLPFYISQRHGAQKSGSGGQCKVVPRSLGIASTASGKPLSPSMQAIRISSTPGEFRSVSTDSQDLAPSFSAV
nr:hypothetical protein [uncultured Pedobacter sp.]